MRQFTVKTALLIAVFLLMLGVTVFGRDTLSVLLHTLRLIPEQASFTELYFVERPHLEGADGTRTVRYSYKLVSHESERMTHHLVSYLEHGEDGQTEVRDDALTLAVGEQRVFEERVVLNGPLATTTVVVMLSDRGQELRFRFP